MSASDQDRHESLGERARERARFSWKIIPLFALSFLLIAVLVNRVSSAEELLETMRHARWELAPLPIALLLGHLAMGTVRWRIMLSAMGVELSFWRALKIILSVWPFALLTPSRANELLRAVALKDELPIPAGMSSVVAERLVDIQSLLLLSTIGALAHQMWDWAALGAAGLIGEWSAAWLILTQRERLTRVGFLAKRAATIEKLFAAFTALSADPKSFIKLSFASITCWLIATGLVVSLTALFGSQLSFTHVVALWPLAVFAGMLPLSVSGMGTRDAAFVYLLKWTSVAQFDETSILAATLFYALLTMVIPSALGFPLMLEWLSSMSWSLFGSTQKDRV